MLRIALAACPLFAALIISMGLFDSAPAQAGGYYGYRPGYHSSYWPYRPAYRGPSYGYRSGYRPYRSAYYGRPAYRGGYYGGRPYRPYHGGYADTGYDPGDDAGYVTAGYDNPDYGYDSPGYGYDVGYRYAGYDGGYSSPACVARTVYIPNGWSWSRSYDYQC